MEPIDSTIVFSSFFMEGIEFRLRKGLKSRMDLRTVQLPLTGKMEVQTTMKSRQLNESLSYELGSMTKPMAIILTTASAKKIQVNQPSS
jgi:hypothetical protein